MNLGKRPQVRPSSVSNAPMRASLTRVLLAPGAVRRRRHEGKRVGGGVRHWALALPINIKWLSTTTLSKPEPAAAFLIPESKSKLTYISVGDATAAAPAGGGGSCSSWAASAMGMGTTGTGLRISLCPQGPWRCPLLHIRIIQPRRQPLYSWRSTSIVEAEGWKQLSFLHPAREEVEVEHANNQQHT